MSGIIQLLPDHIANQIAAGEVIQRPSSVVKELMENAIDAGATRIDVILKDAGRTLVQIIDNGSGMSMFDAQMCFERHATSKLHTAEDLFHLQTKGFRGEALASIAAIAHVALKTCLQSEQIGTLLEIEGSQISKNEPTVCACGTSFEVKNLFYNVPARRNFLKSDAVEFKHVLQEFERLALPHFNLNFSLTHNGQTVYQLSATNLRKRIVDLYGKNYNDKLVPIEENTQIVNIHGFVGKPETAKKTRGDQFLFVNNRYFKDPYFNNAVQKAFDKLILPNTHASYYLFFDIDPTRIDVNVHPTKTEIKFEEDRSIYSILLTTVKTGLGKYHISPTLDFEQETSFDVPYSQRNAEVILPEIRVNKDYNPFKTNTLSPSSSNSIPSGYSPAISRSNFDIPKDEPHSWENFYDIKEEVDEQPLELGLSTENFSSSIFIFSGNFMLTNVEHGLLSIHYRRAMERVVYDEVMDSFLMHPVASQVLLFPYDFDMKAEEILHWVENEKLLKQLGMNWKIEGNKLEILAVPSLLQEESIHELMLLLKDQLALQQIDKGEIAHNFVLSLAKAASMHKRIVDSIESARHLTQSLFSREHPALSPSGKQIIKLIQTTELGNL